MEKEENFLKDTSKCDNQQHNSFETNCEAEKLEITPACENKTGSFNPAELESDDDGVPHKKYMQVPKSNSLMPSYTQDNKYQSHVAVSNETQVPSTSTTSKVAATRCLKNENDKFSTKKKYYGMSSFYERLKTFFQEACENLNKIEL